MSIYYLFCIGKNLEKRQQNQRQRSSVEQHLDTETKLHFAYTSKNMSNNATGKNWMSKTLSLQSFLSDARHLWVYIIAKWRKPIMTH